MIVCKKTSEEELLKLIENIRNSMSETKYSVSIGYNYSTVIDKSIDQMVKESDEMMYADKAAYYARTGEKR